MASWRSMTKIAGSGSISQRHGSADPDPHKNVMEPKHCFATRKSTKVHLWLGISPIHTVQDPGRGEAGYPPLLSVCVLVPCRLQADQYVRAEIFFMLKNPSKTSENMNNVFYLHLSHHVGKVSPTQILLNIMIKTSTTWIITVPVHIEIWWEGSSMESNFLADYFFVRLGKAWHGDCNREGWYTEFDVFTLQQVNFGKRRSYTPITYFKYTKLLKISPGRKNFTLNSLDAIRSLKLTKAECLTVERLIGYLRDWGRRDICSAGTWGLWRWRSLCNWFSTPPPPTLVSSHRSRFPPPPSSH